MKLYLSILSFFFFTTFNSFSQSNSALFLGAEYSYGEQVSGLGVAMDLGYFFENSRIGINAGLSGGPGFGKYLNDLSSSEIMSSVYDQMSGNTYIDRDSPDDTDGCFYLSGRFLLMYAVKNTSFKLAIGPRFNYFTAQEASFLVTSSDAQYEYAEFVQVPYKESSTIYGFEVNMTFMDAVSLKYARMNIEDSEEPMHSLGITFTMGFLSYASY